MLRKLLVFPSVILGMILGLLTHGFFFEPESRGDRATWEYWILAAVILGIEALLTWAVWRVRSATFGLRPVQFRIAWVGAFLLGAVGTPLIYQYADLAK